MTQHINLPNCIVAQSGGPTVAINASLVGESLAEAANSIWSLAKMKLTLVHVPRLPTPLTLPEPPTPPIP